MLTLDPIMPPPTRLTVARMSAAELASLAIDKYGAGAVAYLRKQANHAHRADDRMKYREALAMLSEDGDDSGTGT